MTAENSFSLKLNLGAHDVLPKLLPLNLQRFPLRNEKETEFLILEESPLFNEYV